MSALALASCGEKVVVLGQAAPKPYRFDPPTLVAELALGGRSDNPTLTADLLEIYFTSDTDQGGTTASGDVWYARRDNPSAAFMSPTPLASINSAAFETSSAISSDGLTLWFGSDRLLADDLDVWVSTRKDRVSPWSAPTRVAELSSPARDVPRPLGEHDAVMPLSSERANPNLYQSYFAKRNPSGLFSSPSAVPELAFSDRSTGDGFLTDDGLAFFYSSGAASAPEDLYVSFRKTLDDPFSVTLALDDLNTSADDRDPWLSSDGRHFFFSSDRSGTLLIYEAAVQPR